MAFHSINEGVAPRDGPPSIRVAYHSNPRSRDATIESRLGPERSLMPCSGLGRRQRDLRRAGKVLHQGAHLMLGEGRPEIIRHHRLLALSALGDLALGQGDS